MRAHATRPWRGRRRRRRSRSDSTPRISAARPARVAISAALPRRMAISTSARMRCALRVRSRSPAPTGSSTTGTPAALAARPARIIDSTHSVVSVPMLSTSAPATVAISGDLLRSVGHHRQSTDRERGVGGLVHHDEVGDLVHERALLADPAERFARCQRRGGLEVRGHDGRPTLKGAGRRATGRVCTKSSKSADAACRSPPSTGASARLRTSRTSTGPSPEPMSTRPWATAADAISAAARAAGASGHPWARYLPDAGE